MKTNTNAFRLRNDSLLSLILWMATAFVIFSLAQKAQGAVTVTSISSAPSTSGSHGRLILRVGDGTQTSFKEAELVGSNSAFAQYEWRVNQGTGAQSTLTAINLSLAGSSMSASLNGNNGFQNLTPSPVNYSTNLGPINTLHIYLTSSVAEGNTMSAQSITLAQLGLGTQSIGGLSVSGVESTGIKVEFTGGSDTATLQFNQVFSRTAGTFFPGSGSNQVLTVYASHNPAIPEPSSLMMVLIAGVSVCTYRKRNRPTK